ncbi:MAG: hypothetical protein IT443_02060 [Phycisphaeraceae bacterium]|nr:hypothetical protein [Phycisphaeraceae bacterium]
MTSKPSWLRRILLLAMLASLAGCSKALFPEDLPRSQYERYSTLRGRERPKKETNAFGREMPALRERLSPLDEDF